MSCDVSLQQDLIDKIQEDVYTVCSPLPTLVLTANDLAIIESGAWCGYQPTYSTMNYPAVTTVADVVKSAVYNEMMNEFNGIKAGIEGSMALNYSTKLERNSDAEALAAKIDISYSQLNTAMHAQATSFQSALTNTAYALSEQISTTEANMLGGFNAATTFYQSSLATLSDAYAEAGLLVTATSAVGGKVISGFKATADTEKSEFVIFADTFKVINDLNDEAHAPFTVQNGVVYIGAVDTSQPQITYLGQFASSPTTRVVNSVYKNTSNGNSYIWNGSSWVLWLERGVDGVAGATGANGANGANGNRGTAILNYSADLGSVAASSVASANIATYWNSAAPSNQDTEIEGDQLILTNTNTSYGWTNIYTFNGSSWVNNTKLVVNGDAVVNGTLSVSALVSSGTLSGIGLSLSGGNSWTTAGDMYVSNIKGVGNIIASGNINCKDFTAYGTISGIDYSDVGAAAASHSHTASSITSWSSLSMSGSFGCTNTTGAWFNSGSNAVGINSQVSSTASYGFQTNGKIKSVLYNGFTGSHLGFMTSEPVVGDIVSATGKMYHYDVNENYTVLEVTSVAKDKRVFGVVSDYTAEDIASKLEVDTLFYDTIAMITMEDIVTEELDDEGEIVEVIVQQPRTEYVRVLKDGYADTVAGILAESSALVHTNSVGEGGINVCSEGGNIAVGDYICSSNVLGKGMKQDDDLLHNYTVAKALEAVDWSTEELTTKMIACTYHCG